MDRDELLYIYTLHSVLGNHLVMAKEIYEAFPKLSEFFNLPREDIENLFSRKKHLVNSLLNYKSLELARKDIRWFEEHDIKIVTLFESDYPKRLKECKDAPIIFFYQGTADIQQERILSIVGTRTPTPYGRDYCKRIIEYLSTLEIKPVIVSGLAYGIDIYAHRLALDCGLETIAVMGTALDRIYPSIHRSDASRILTQGGLLSDLCLSSTTIPSNFLRRNRLIAGISDATILIESGVRGGGINTCLSAQSYSRNVFALPGRLSDELSLGCIRMIKENVAETIFSPTSLCKSLGWESTKRPRFDTKRLILEENNEVKRKILLLLSHYLPMDINTLLEKSELDLSDLIQNLTELELDGRIQSDLLGRYSIA